MGDGMMADGNMWFGWGGMILIAVLVILAIAVLAKYLMKLVLWSFRFAIFAIPNFVSLKSNASA